MTGEQRGWTCPKCGRVWAPFITECSSCNNAPGAATSQITGPSWWWCTSCGHAHVVGYVCKKVLS